MYNSFIHQTFLLCFHLFPSFHFPDLRGDGLPVRWSAVESILQDLYDAKTDIWMFGHVIHELFTYGCEPYTDQYSVNTDDIISGVIVIISFAVDKVFGLVKDHNFEKVTDLGSVLGGHYKLSNHLLHNRRG